MNKKLLIGSLFLLILIAGLYLLWPSDEKRIRRLFEKGAKAVEVEDLDGVMSVISYNYRDDYGVTYLYLKNLLKKEFDIMSDVDVEYEDLEIKVLKGGKGESPQVSGRATAEMKVRVIATIGNETGYILGDIKTPLQLTFTLNKERAKWLIVKTEGYIQDGRISQGPF